jgi:HEAT repeat protein
VVALLNAPVRGQQKEESRPATFEEKTGAIEFIPFTARVLGFVPDFDWIGLNGRLAEEVQPNNPLYKELRAFPRELIKELRRDDTVRKPEAMATFTRYVRMLYCFARLQGDNGKDLLPCALGKHLEPAKESLRMVLKSTRQTERLQAATILLELVPNHAQASAIVVAELKGQDADQRKLACDLIRTLCIADPDVLNAVVAAVKDKNDEVRQAAAYAVANIGPRAAAAIPGLIDLLKSGDAAYADVGFEFMPLGLVPEYRNVALLALSKMGGSARHVVPIISGKLAGAARDLLKVPTWEKQMNPNDPSELDELLSCLAELGPVAGDAVPHIRDFIKFFQSAPNNPARVNLSTKILAASAVLLRIDPTDSVALDYLKNALRSQDEKTRLQALTVCATFGPKVKAFIPFIAAALKVETDGASYRAAEALGKMGPLAEEAIPDIVGVAVSFKDRHDHIEFDYFDTLAKIGKASVPALMKLLRHREAEVRQHAAQALGLIGRDAAAAVPLLVEAASSRKKDDATPIFAVVALGRMQSSAAAARGPLQRFFDQEPDCLTAWALTQFSR